MSERDVLTVDFFPQKVPFPTFTNEQYLLQTAEDMLHLLTPKPTSPPSVSLDFGPPVVNAFAQVAKLLGRAIAPPSQPTTPLVSAAQSVPNEIPVAPPRVPIQPVSTPSQPTTPLVSTAQSIPNEIPVAPPRVPIQPVSTPLAGTALRDLTNLSAAPAPRAVALPKQKPLSSAEPHRTRSTTRIRASPCFNQLYQRRNNRLAPTGHLAQSIQHDPTVAGKMYDPVTGRAETIDSLLRGPDKVKWTRSLANEWGRCTRGLKNGRSPADVIKGNHTMVFVRTHQLPAGRKATYANFVVTMRPGKSEIYQVGMTIGGDRLEAYQDVRSPAVIIFTRSSISTPPSRTPQLAPATAPAT
jgi:hypothetical protein